MVSSGEGVCDFLAGFSAIFGAEPALGLVTLPFNVSLDNLSTILGFRARGFFPSCPVLAGSVCVGSVEAVLDTRFLGLGLLDFGAAPFLFPGSSSPTPGSGRFSHPILPLSTDPLSEKLSDGFRPGVTLLAWGRTGRDIDGVLSNDEPAEMYGEVWGDSHTTGVGDRANICAAGEDEMQMTSGLMVDDSG